MGKGIKVCPICDSKVGSRTKICSNCQYQFIKKTKETTQLISAGRGRKTCVCGLVVGARQKVCKKCKHVFQFTPNHFKEKRSNVDWRELVKGDFIRVIQGTGPYWTIINEDGDTEQVNLGYNGIFKVHAINENGIRAYPVAKNKESGHCHIYMGEAKKVLEGLVKVPHRIVKVRRKVR